MPTRKILALLTGGDRRSLGRANQVVAKVSKDPSLFPELLRSLWSDDPIVRMRVADAAEKVTRNQPHLLQPFKRELLGLMAETAQQELRWHLAAMAPRLKLNSWDLHLVQSILKTYLDDRSSIVKTFALQALADLATQHPAMRPEVIEILRHSAHNGTPAMKARTRRLLPKLERMQTKTSPYKHSNF